MSKIFKNRFNVSDPVLCKAQERIKVFKVVRNKKLEILIIDNFFACQVMVRDCSLFIGSMGTVFRGTGQGLFLMLPSRGHKDFLCFYGTGHELFLEKISQIIFVYLRVVTLIDWDMRCAIFEGTISAGK